MRWNELNETTQRAIVAFVVVVTALLVLALFGYLNGSWETPN